MNDEATEAIQDTVDGLNAEINAIMDGRTPGEAVRETMKRVGTIHYHEPWDTAFTVTIDGTQGIVLSEALDAFFVGDLPHIPSGEIRRRVDFEKAGSDPPVTAYYRPEGGDGPSIDLEWHPIEGAESTYRAVGANREPVPDIRLSVIALSDATPNVTGSTHAT